MGTGGSSTSDGEPPPPTPDELARAEREPFAERDLSIRIGIGKSDFDLFAEAHAQQAYDDEQRIIQTGEPLLDAEEKETWPDGRITWCLSTKSAYA